MIKALDVVYERDDNVNRYVVVTLVADTCDEVIAHGVSGRGVENMQKCEIMTFGSTCLCVDGRWGMLNSAGEWIFK